jgi:two-component system sensor histidine kinase CpxA
MYADRAANIYERQGESALSDYINSVKKVAGLDAFFFNERGEEISGRNPSPGVKDLAAQACRKNDPKPSFSGKDPLVAQSVRTPGRHRYVMVAEVMPCGLNRPGPGPPFPWLGFLGIGNTGARALFLRLAAVLAAAGTVCYGLAHYLTAPLVQLRTATQRLSRGDLKARFGKPRGGRHDELTDLGQDFDRMAERIESMMAAQRRLLSDISHELRSPLARINLAAGLIRQRQKAQSDAELDRIELEAKRLDILIGQLLSLTRLEGGADGSEKKPIDLSPLLRTIVEDADFEAQSRDRAVRITRSQSLTVLGNQGLVCSAVENVVRNAVYYTREGTAVEVSLEPETRGGDTFTVIHVRDFGDGVPESSLGDLFRPFYRVADARDRQSGGVGLGLAIAEQAVRWHGGSIKAFNADGGGLMVELLFPRA